VRIHVFEFIGGGGLAEAPLPGQLAREGDLMLCAVVDDLLELPGVEVSFARDARLPLPAQERLRAARVCWREPGVAAARALAHEMAASDAVWPIAPETGGELERSARAVLAADRLLLGPHPDAIGLATSKSATARRLAQAGIDVVPCFAPGTQWPRIDGPWIVKPDDGAGCVQARTVAGRDEAAAALGATAGGMIAQPWIAGDARSLCVLVAQGKTDVASVNRQHLQLDRGIVGLAAIDVNCEAVTAPLQALAERVATAIPGLNGYFGIDYIQAAAGPIVVEVNPRVTSSYAGLRAALELNAAEWVLAAATGGPAPSKKAHRGQAVRLNLDAP
jgi:predicted ATP-grasp superfamily ATP-dependent carboligase